MDRSVSLEMDRKLRNFNLCVYWDPCLDPTGPFPESRLLQSAYLIRKGDRGDLAEFADALARTIRPETFQAFQKIHGPRPISYSDWYCTKLEQFLGLLLYKELRVLGLGPHGEPGLPQTERPWEEGKGILYGELPVIQRDAIEQAFSPLEVNQIDWLAAIGHLAAAGPRGKEALERWLVRRAARRKQRSDEPHGNKAGHPTRKIQRQAQRREPRHTRDTLIRTWLQIGVRRDQICQRLDQSSIPITRGMEKLGLTSWAAGWEDPEVRASIQTLISKARPPD